MSNMNNKPYAGANDETPILDALLEAYADCHADTPLTVFIDHMASQELEIRDLKEIIKNPSLYGEKK